MPTFLRNLGNPAALSWLSLASWNFFLHFKSWTVLLIFQSKRTLVFTTRHESSYGLSSTMYLANHKIDICIYVMYKNVIANEENMYATNTILFSRVHATLHLALSVGPSVGPSLRNIFKIPFFFLTSYCCSFHIFPFALLLRCLSFGASTIARVIQSCHENPQPKK